jgi:hypothetical protein
MGNVNDFEADTRVGMNLFQQRQYQQQQLQQQQQQQLFYRGNNVHREEEALRRSWYLPLEWNAKPNEVLDGLTSTPPFVAYPGGSKVVVPPDIGLVVMCQETMKVIYVGFMPSTGQKDSVTFGTSVDWDRVRISCRCFTAHYLYQVAEPTYENLIKWPAFVATDKKAVERIMVENDDLFMVIVNKSERSLIVAHRPNPSQRDYEHRRLTNERMERMVIASIEKTGVSTPIPPPSAIVVPRNNVGTQQLPFFPRSQALLPFQPFQPPR